jgi:hypothetical protein
MLQPAELKEIFQHAPNEATGAHAESAQVRAAYLRATGVQVSDEEKPQAGDADADAPGKKRIPSIGEDCPV